MSATLAIIAGLIGIGLIGFSGFHLIKAYVNFLWDE